MISDSEITTRLDDIDHNTIDKVCDLLRQYNTSTQMYFADMVASVCDVNTNDMLVDTKHLHNSHARWFFWYAYRYMTNENYDCIALLTKKHRRFSQSCVGMCVGKMSVMIEKMPIWNKRWTIIKRIIKTINNHYTKDNIQETITLKVQPPKGVDVKLQVIR